MRSHHNSYSWINTAKEMDYVKLIYKSNYYWNYQNHAMHNFLSLIGQNACYSQKHAEVCDNHGYLVLLFLILTWVQIFKRICNVIKNQLLCTYLYGKEMCTMFIFLLGVLESFHQIYWAAANINLDNYQFDNLTICLSLNLIAFIFVLLYDMHLIP